MTRRPTVADAPSSRRRGSTFLLVLSILAVTILVSATLAYGTRLDLLAARNFSDKVGSRIAISSGLTASPPFLQRFTAITAPTQLWARRFGSLRPDDANLHWNDRRADGRPDGAPLASTPPGTYQDRIIHDLSGRLNLNLAGALPIWEARAEGQGPGLGPHELRIETALAAILLERGLDVSLAPRIARELLELRVGPDRAAGIAGRDDNGNAARAALARDGLDNDGDGVVDNREEALLDVARFDRDIPWVAESLRRLGDAADRPFFALEHNGLDNWGLGDAAPRERAGIDEPWESRGDIRHPAVGDDAHLPTTRLLASLPSVTPEVARALAPHVTTFSVSPNVVVVGGAILPRLNLHSASLDDLLAQLRAAYDQHLPDDLLVQFALNVVDRRDPDSARTEAWTRDGRLLRGLEVVPFVSEVYPNARTLAADGDDGQFVEIHNPWDRPIDLAGWTLRAGGRTIVLKKVLPAGGYLVVTDDYRDENDPSANQDSGLRSGSLFGIFGVVDSGEQRQILEAPGFELPDKEGLVRLYDANGDLADEFAYENDLADGTTMSHQRLHPAFPRAALAPATPLAPAIAWERRRDLRAMFTTTDRRVDALYTSLGELLEVSSGWVDAGATDDLDALLHADQFPVLATSGRNFDARVTDLFFLAPPVATQADLRGMNAASARALLQQAYEGAFRQGLINVNTASRPVLLALPGMDERLADAIVAWRTEVIERVRAAAETVLPDVPFARPSDVLTNDALWEGIGEPERRERFGKMANLLSVSSAAFEVTSFMLKRDPGDPTLLKRQAVRGIVALDTPRGHLVSFETIR